MNSRILWLRIAYWTGAIVDAAAVLAMLVPDLNRIFVLDGADIPISIEYRFAMAYGAALMAGWTVLLIWADRKPIERRGILLITAFPVVVCLNLSRVILYVHGVVVGPVPPLALVLPVTLFFLFVFAYFNSRRHEEKTVAPA
jgi:hypothetical protein